MSNEQRIKELIFNLSTTEAPGYADPRDARMNVGKFHQKAREELIKIGAPAVPFLIEKGGDHIDLIKSIGSPAIEPLLSHLQENPDSPYLEFIVRALGILKAEAAADLILGLLQTSDDLEIRTQAAKALGFIHMDRERISSEPMLKLLDDLLAQAEIQADGQYKFANYNDGRRVQEVLGAIGNTGDEQAVESLISLLDKTNDLTKLRVVQALGRIGDERAVGPIIENIESGTELSDLMTKELVGFQDARGKEFAARFVQENPSLRYIQQVKDELAKSSVATQTGPAPNIKGLYIMVFTPEEWGAEKLKETTNVANGMLRAKDPTFKQLMEVQMTPNTRMNITSMQYSPFMHTPQTMQTTLMGWLKKEHSVEFNPTVGKNFFPHGMKDPKGKETFILFYFDMEDGKQLKVAEQKTSTAVPEQPKQEAPATKKRSKWVVIAAVVGVVILCICGAITLLPVIFSLGS